MTFQVRTCRIILMSQELSIISPEGLDVANAYLQFGNIRAVCEFLSLPEYKVAEMLGTREVKKYIDTVYLDTGYRNRDTLGRLMDDIIHKKLEEAEETDVYSSKDLVDILHLAHKMRMDELNLQIKHDSSSTNIKNQTNVQVNGLGHDGSNYGKLMKELMEHGK